MSKSKALSRQHAPRKHSPSRLRSVGARGLRVARRGASAASQRKGMLVGIAGAAALGLAQSKGMAPPSILGMNSTLVTGAILAIAVPLVLKGSMGRMSEQAGTAILAVAAFQIAGGAPVMGADGFGWGVSGDEGGGWNHNQWTGG